MSLLAPDARLVGGSGGHAKAPLRVIGSAGKVGRFLAGIADKSVPHRELRFIEVNGGPAFLVLSDGRPDTVFQLDVVDGQVQCVYVMRIPSKLARLAGF
jgi:RNA polymerase sigma-70 factor (ECF subfamily)